MKGIKNFAFWPRKDGKRAEEKNNDNVGLGQGTYF